MQTSRAPFTHRPISNNVICSSMWISTFEFSVKFIQTILLLNTKTIETTTYDVNGAAACTKYHFFSSSTPRITAAYKWNMNYAVTRDSKFNKHPWLTTSVFTYTAFNSVFNDNKYMFCGGPGAFASVCIILKHLLITLRISVLIVHALNQIHHFSVRSRRRTREQWN